MIIHIISSKEYSTEELSVTSMGMHPITLDGRTIANIENSNNDWEIKLEENYDFENSTVKVDKIRQYKVYSIFSRLSLEKIHIVITPRFYQNTLVFNVADQLTIGNQPSCDIYYPTPFVDQEIFLISRYDTFWKANTSSNNFFLNNERYQNGKKIMYGDSIFYFGLNIIFLGNKIVVKTPQNLFKVNSSKLQQTTNQPNIQDANAPDEVIDESLPLYQEKDYYNKTPRYDYYVEEAEASIDEPPAPEKPSSVPLIVQIGPQITMGAMSALSATSLIVNFTSTTSSSSARKVTMIISIITMGLTILSTILWPSLSRHITKKRRLKREEKRQKKYKDYLKHKGDHLAFIKKVQKETLENNNPTLEECAQIIKTRNSRLWQRNIDHEDFLSVRIGIGDVPTKLKLDDPKETFSIDEEDDLRLLLKKTITDAKTINNAPITYNLTENIINSVIGDKYILKNFIECMMLEILTLHSSSDLKIVVFSKDESFCDFSKIVPHCWNNELTTRYYANTVENFNAITADIEKIFDARKSNDEEEKQEDDGSEVTPEKPTFTDFKPYYLFVIEDFSLIRKTSIISKILKYKKNLGFSILIASDRLNALPAEAARFISVTKDKSAIMDARTSRKNQVFEAGFNTGTVDIYDACWDLANIPIQIEKGKFELPKSLAFLEMYGCGNVKQLNSLSRWKNNDPSNSLSVQIGIDQNNEPFMMDIHEKASGPHGLIAGTTGSGKSEWIITYILSLAVSFSPDEVQFVLIDYKGGGLAKSFENSELGIKLPHLAGVITNLDKSDIYRSISAIESELKRRQAIFNNTREKLKEGQMDIYKYQRHYRNGDVDEPMSHMIIICDEFAELKKQEPDFMDQLISTSRIGRSLGVHLILATQKPSGVVNEQIWSNSKFKVALKVQSKGDSMEILKNPDAAYLKQVGSFYMQVGNDDYYNLGQSAWAGAKYFPSNTVIHKTDTSIQEIDTTGKVIGRYEEKEEVAESEGDQLLHIVSYISEISKKIELKAKPMWLENVSPNSLLSDLRKKYKATVPEKYTYETIIGEYDEPRKQDQGLLKVDISKGNIAIAGKNDGSIEKLISTLVWSSVSEHTPAEIAYYIIDYGAETLKKFANFPHVGEVLFQSESNKIAGLMDMINDEMQRRKEILSNYSGSFEVYNRQNEKKMHLIVVIINNFDVLTQTMPRATESLNEYFREAPKCGIVFIVSTNAPSGIPARLLSNFNHYILMQLADDSNYRGLSNCRRGLIPKKVIGRGICKLDPTSVDSYCEFQTASIDTEDNENKTIRDFAKRSVDYYKCKVRQLAKIPDDIQSSDLISRINEINDTPIGISLHQKDLATYDLSSQKIHIFAGHVISNSIESIYALTKVMTKLPNVKVRVLDLLGIFKMPILDIQKFDQDPNDVVAALEKDIKVRTAQSSCGINIIIGAGRYKQLLNPQGQQAFENIIKTADSSKQTIYIFIDNYDTIRTFKVEDWFDKIGKNGLWLGAAPQDQTLFEGIKFSEEDLNYNYPGLAYKLTDGEYDVIKLAIDKDI